MHYLGLLVGKRNIDSTSHVTDFITRVVKVKESIYKSDTEGCDSVSSYERNDNIAKLELPVVPMHLCTSISCRIAPPSFPIVTCS